MNGNTMYRTAIIQKMEENNNILTASQLLELGMSKMALTNYVRSGFLVRLAHGYYALSETVEDDMFLLGQRFSYIVFSHETALFLNGLSNRAPFVHSVTIPSNTSLPSSMNGEYKCYYVKPELHRVGVIKQQTTFSHTVTCYNPERTMCDIIHSRHRMDDETVIAALKNYAHYSHKDLIKLGEYAQMFNVERKLREYMELLL